MWAGNGAGSLYEGTLDITAHINMIQNVQLGLVLHPNQKVIHNSTAKNKVIKAGKRFGKTKWALFEICQAAGQTQNGVFWYIAPTYKQAKFIAWWELNWLLPKWVVRRSVENELVKELTSGSRIQLIGADNEEALRGPRLSGVVLDEAAYMKEYVWYGIISGQLLGAQGAKSGFAYFISSPNKTGRNWFSGFYDQAASKEKNGDKDWSSHFYTIYDNPTLDRDEIEKLKANTPDDTWNLEYLAQESAHSGQIFSEFDYSKHVEEVPPSGELVRGLDWGIGHPTVCLWVYVNVLTKQVYVSDEFVRSDKLIHESCSIIKQKTGSRPVEWSVIDPSTNKRNSQTPRTDRDEFSRNGIYCIPADNKDRGYDITKMFFKSNMIKIHPKCKNLIYGLRNVQYGDKTGDDETDVLRYILTRVHDIMFGRLFEKNTIVQSPWKRRPYNVNDPILFPKNEETPTSSIVEALRSY